MIPMIGRLKAKKGFTIIELIVVVAIIGILIAMVVPAIMYDNRPAKGKVLAKNAFYTVQDAMTSLKSSSPKALDNCQTLFDEENSFVVFYANISAAGTISESGVLKNRTKVKFADVPTQFSISNADQKTDFNKMMSKVQTAIQEYTESLDSMTGTLFIAVDSGFRVQMAYWTEITTEGTIAKSSTISVRSDDMYTIGGMDYYFVSFPAEYSMSGKAVFKYWT